MKRYVFIGLLLVCASRSDARYSGGSGTALDPYLIATAQDLAGLGTDEDSWSRHFRLAGDIDMADLPSPVSCTIGNDELPFTGVFDGGGRAIRNFTCISPPGDSAGLFGQVRAADALICDVILVDPNVEATAANYMSTGALVGRLRSGTVTRCRVERAQVRGYSSVGILVGWNQGEISYSQVTGTVSGKYSVGGLTGTTFWGQDIHHCQADVTVVGINRVGGLAGNCSLAAIAWCSSKGIVEGYDYVGGFAGSSEGGLLSNSYSTASVSGTARVGGFLGQNSWSCDCSAGAYPAELTFCYATGQVTGQTQAGGLVGSDDNCIVFGSFWDVEASGLTYSDIGTGATTAELQTQRTFLEANWDFTPKAGSNDYWVIQEGQSYPIPAWQSIEIPEGDLNSDTVVDLKDFSILAQSWQAKSDDFANGGVNLAADACVDARDLRVICRHWLDRMPHPEAR